jgi:hypothetical protein
MSDRVLKFRGGGGPALGAVLSELKRTGCAILLAGESRVAREAMSQRLFGSPTVDRHRVFVTPNDDYPTEPWLPRGVARDAVETVSYSSGERSIATASPQATGLDGTLRELDTAISLNPYEFESGVLRTGVHTADALAETYGREAALSFVSSVFERVREKRGMGHVHLDGSTADPLFGHLESLVDAVVELRVPKSRQPEQRWYIPEYGYTNWVLISPGD